jgi:hypothetical protein
MFIEFIFSERAALAAVYELELEEEFEQVRIANKRVITVLQLSRPYVRANILAIIGDSFRLNRSEARALLESLSASYTGE